ncbi:MAG: DoxX family membrane protein [Candidatus Acidiferrales bacterium]
MKTPAFLTVIAAWASLRLPTDVLCGYLMGAALSVVGAFAVRREFAQARGSEKLLPLGRLFFAIPMAIFGTEHFTNTRSIAGIVPSWIPGHLFWTYFCGTALIAAGLSIVLRKYSGLAAALLSLMLFLFVLLMSAPAVKANPADSFVWAVALRDFSFSAGALAFAATHTREWRTTGASKLVTLARFCFASTVIFFGAMQLLHPAHVPGVPLERLTPAWIPGHILWSYLAGAVYLVAGVGLLAGRKMRLAAASVGVMVLLLMVFVYLPILAASLADLANGLNYFADTLAFAGAALLLAEALPREGKAHV